MGLFRKKVTLLAMVLQSGQPLSEVWGTLRGPEVLSALARHGLKHDEDSMERVSNAMEMSQTYPIVGRPDVSIEWRVERREQPGWVSITVKGDRETVDAAAAAFASVEHFIPQELRGVRVQIMR